MKEETESKNPLKVNITEATTPSKKSIEAGKKQPLDYKKGITGNDFLNTMFEQEDKNNVVSAIDTKNRESLEAEIKKVKNKKENSTNAMHVSSKRSNIAAGEQDTHTSSKAPIKRTIELTKTEPFLFSNIIESSELQNEQLEVYNTEILKDYRANTRLFISKKNWTANDLREFLKKVNKNDEELYDLFNIINNELQQDLIECEEDLKIINDELQMWQIAGISIDVSRTQVKVDQAISWINSKKAQVQSSIEHFSLTTNSIKNNINMYYQGKENSPS